MTPTYGIQGSDSETFPSRTRTYEFHDRAGQTILVADFSDADFHRAAEAEAYARKALGFVRHHENFVESIHRDFRCREDEAGEHLIVTTPIGEFRLAARRARKGQSKTAIVAAPGMRAFGATAAEDQLSLPTRIEGRLNEPDRRFSWSGWRFQPTAIFYEDGTHSDYLGDYPREIEWCP